jgi:hypothetical protein
MNSCVYPRSATAAGIIAVVICVFVMAGRAAADHSASPSLTALGEGVDVEAATLDPESIKCRVCAAAITYIWRTGTQLREDCLANPRRDRRCGGDFVSFKRTHQLVEDACYHLPLNHRKVSTPQLPFELEHDSDAKVGPVHKPKNQSETSANADSHHADAHPETAADAANGTTAEKQRKRHHNDADAKVITDACVKWVHSRHTTEKVAKYIFKHLDVGETDETALRFLRRRFCYPACAHGRRLLRHPRDDDEL